MYALFLSVTLCSTPADDAARAAVAVELAKLSLKKAESDPFQKPVVKQSLTAQEAAAVQPATEKRPLVGVKPRVVGLGGSEGPRPFSMPRTAARRAGARNSSSIVTGPMDVTSIGARGTQRYGFIDCSSGG